jgi:hypothetical protein
MHLQIRRIALGSAVSACLIAAPAALGQTTSAQEGYSAPAGSVQQQLRGPREDAVRGTTVVSNRDTTAGGAAQGGLPFTGLDIAFVIGAGGVLLAVGASIRRLSSRQT